MVAKMKKRTGSDAVWNNLPLPQIFLNKFSISSIEAYPIDLALYLITESTHQNFIQPTWLGLKNSLTTFLQKGLFYFFNFFFNPYRYDIKQSDGEAPVIHKFWGMWSTPSLLSQVHSDGVVTTNRVLSIDQIDMFDI